MLCIAQWTTVGDVDIDIGANPSAEDAEEGVEANNRKTVDIIESFRLNVGTAVQHPDIHFRLMSPSHIHFKIYLHIHLLMTSSVCIPRYNCWSQRIQHLYIVMLHCCLWLARQYACADCAHAYTSLVRLLAAHGRLHDMQEQPTYDKKQFMGWAKVSDMHRNSFSCLLMEGRSGLRMSFWKLDDGVYPG